MIFDHRTYNVHPGKTAEFVELYGSEGYPLQLKHLGDCVGWYVSMDIGPLNQVVHIWRYSNIGDRAERRARLAADLDWQTYLKKVTDLLQSMENKILVAAPFWSPTQ